MNRACATFAAFAAAVGLAAACKHRDPIVMDAGDLPPVEPHGPRCDDINVEPGKRCVQEGWFAFSRWTTAVLYGPDADAAAVIPQRPIYLDTFLIDEREITNAQYLSFITQSGGAAPPEQCGYVDRYFRDVIEEIADPEISGWTNGAPAAELHDHPVVCVTRTEARAFCEARGGRLPTVFEWARLARDAFPDARRFPWGNSPPPEAGPPWPDPGPRWWEAYAIVSRSNFGGLRTAQVGSASAGASPVGALDIAGNVSELLSSCGEDLALIPETTEPFVRPDGGGQQTRCEDGVVVAGSNWRSFLISELVLASSVFVMRDGFDGFRYPDSSHRVYYGSSRDFWGHANPAGTVLDTAGNDRRSWRIGFRCAYDVASQL